MSTVTASKFADIPPAIIHILQVLLDREAYPPDHAKWVEDGARAILKNWQDSEDLGQLKLDLGLVGKKRRKAITVRRETGIVVAIVDAALAGAENPKRVAGDNLQADEREIQRAWKKWGLHYLESLSGQKSNVSPEDCSKIQRAIEILKPADKN